MTTIWMTAVLLVAQAGESPNSKPADGSATTSQTVASQSAASQSAASQSAAAAAKNPAQNPSQCVERTLPEWKQAVAEALQKTAGAKDEALDKAAETLVNVYRDLASETKLTKDDREKLRQQLRERLLTVRQNLLARIKKDQNAILAQQLPAGRGGAGLNGAGAGANGGGKNLQGAVDHGKELADLIQAVIAPQSWESMGGPGVIRYWAPGSALIINQSSETHEQIEDVIRQLRRAN